MGTHQGNELARNTSGNVRPQSSQLAKRVEFARADLNCKKKKKKEEEGSLYAYVVCVFR